jgi:septum site-determining protein MinC
LKEEKPFEGIYEGITKFINTTIRSGQVIEYHGNIVIIGDVNPGALIKAKGNIIILGTLRGVAHAGIDGNYEAIVAAYDLQPTQLRIANIIGRKPDGDIAPSGLPEIAKIHDGEVLIEPYLPRK